MPVKKYAFKLSRCGLICLEICVSLSHLYLSCREEKSAKVRDLRIEKCSRKRGAVMVPRYVPKILNADFKINIGQIPVGTVKPRIIF